VTLAIVTLCSVLPFPADCGPPPVDVFLSQYEVGIMPHVVEAQQGWERLPAVIPVYVDGFVAHWDCDRIGDVAYLSIDGTEPIVVRVSDCSGHQSTTDWLLNNNIEFEISGELAHEYDVVCLCLVPGTVTWLN
jgi:hypothetical protein